MPQAECHWTITFAGSVLAVAAPCVVGLHLKGVLLIDVLLISSQRSVCVCMLTSFAE